MNMVDLLKDQDQTLRMPIPMQLDSEECKMRLKVSKLLMKTIEKMVLINRRLKMPGELKPHIHGTLKIHYLKELTQLMLTLTQPDLVI